MAKSTLGVLCAATQRSASIRSIVIEALASRPTNSPTWTYTRATANATPETVVRNRALSSRRILTARSTIAQPSFGERSAASPSGIGGFSRWSWKARARIQSGIRWVIHIMAAVRLGKL